MRKRGIPHYLRVRAETILWPYVLWSVLLTLLLIPLSKFATHQAPATLRDFLVLLFTGALSWFLPTLLFAITVAALLYRLPKWLLFAISVALMLLVPDNPVVWLTRGVAFLPFLVIGMWVADRMSAFADSVPAGSTALALSCVIAVVLGWGVTRNLQRPALGMLVFGCVGTLMLLMISRCMGYGSRIAGLRMVRCGVTGYLPTGGVSAGRPARAAAVTCTS